MASNKKPWGFTIVLVPERSALDNGLGNARKLLLSAAEEVFGEHGFHRSSVSHICRHAGLLENICAEKGDRVKIVKPGEAVTMEEIEGKVCEGLRAELIKFYGGSLCRGRSTF